MPRSHAAQGVGDKTMAICGQIQGKWQIKNAAGKNLRRRSDGLSAYHWISTGMAPENAKNSVIHQMNLDGVNGTTVQMPF